MRAKFSLARLLIATVAALSVLVSAGPASALVYLPLDGADFKPGQIVTNKQFFDTNPMTEAEIQAFLDYKIEQNGGCTSTADRCLNVYRQTTVTRVATSIHGNGVNPLCAEYTGATSEPASRIIFKVQNACHISAKTLLVTLEKEQGLVTNTNPSAGKLNIAMGYACPDTAPCDEKYYGFFNQVYSAASQLKRYTDPASAFYNSKPVSTTANPRITNIYYNPDHSCGTKPVEILNAATHALYIYTPYTPNEAALANLGGSGDSCSAYGNRNFWYFYNKWFNLKSTIKANVTAATNDGDLSIGAIVSETDCTSTDNACAIEYESGYAAWKLPRSFFTVTGTIAEAYRANGGPAGALGEVWGTARTVEGGTRQAFQNAAIYRNGDGATTIVPRDIDTFLRANGGTAGDLGWPVAAATCTDGRCVQRFAGGLIMSDPEGGFHTVTGVTAETIVANGGLTNPWGLPLEDAVSVTNANFGNGQTQQFAAGTVWAGDGRAVLVSTTTIAAVANLGGNQAVGWPRAAASVVGAQSSQSFTAGIVVSVSEGRGKLVPVVLRTAYRTNGGLGGFLGAPRRAMSSITYRDGTTGNAQLFVGGSIMSGPAGAFALPAQVRAAYIARGGVSSTLRWPTGEATVSGNYWIQQFAGGRIKVLR